MKRLWLVAESLPLKADGTPRKARKSASLPETLIPLDPRHGVFPNLVMKPLFAAGFFLSKNHDVNLHEYFQELTVIVQDVSDRRFNVFRDRPTKPKKQSATQEEGHQLDSEVFAINTNELTDRVNNFDLENDLWLMFGHQTTYGFLFWLLKPHAPFQVDRDEIKEFSDKFVKMVGEISSNYACGKKSQLSRRIGLLHRLCTGKETSTILEQVISMLAAKTNSCFSNEKIVGLLRSTVPLLHNEGYQDGANPTGNAQDHFVQQAKGKSTDGDLYWQVMGDSISTRILGNFVD